LAPSEENASFALILRLRRSIGPRAPAQKST
jgi:hypothetical protein